MLAIAQDFSVKSDALKPLFSQNSEKVKRVTIAEIPENVGQNFESYGFRMQDEIILFNLKDEAGNPILELGKTAKNQTRDSVLVYCTRILPDGTSSESRFNLNALVVTDINQEGYGDGFKKMRNGFSNHSERVQYLFSKDKPMALKCTSIQKRTFPKFVNGQRTSDTEQRNYAEYEIIEQ